MKIGDFQRAEERVGTKTMLRDSICIELLNEISFVDEGSGSDDSSDKRAQQPIEILANLPSGAMP